MTQIQIRRGTAALWASNNPTLALGEIGYETDTKKAKMGDGATLWNALPYWIPTLPTGTVVGTTDSQTLTNKTISGASNTITNIPTSALPLNGVQSAYVSTMQSLTSPQLTFVDLATTTDQVTVTIGASGMALVIFSANMYNTNSGQQALMGVQVPGVGIPGYLIIRTNSTVASQQGSSAVVTGLTPGSLTCKLKYMNTTTASTSYFGDRYLAVIPL